MSHFSSLTPDKPAIICKGQVLSYAELWERVQERSRQLRDEGLREGQPYDFVMSQDVDSIVTYCAVQCCGASSILYTTGTTGSAKGVIISAKAWTANAENLIDRLVGVSGPSGNENDLYVSNDIIYKVNNLLNSGSILQLLNRLIWHNNLFYETAYTFFGFTGFDGRTVP